MTEPSEDVDQRFGRGVKAARERLGLTQGDLARLVATSGNGGVSLATISKLERNERRVRLWVARALADALVMTIDELLNEPATCGVVPVSVSGDAAAEWACQLPDGHRGHHRHEREDGTVMRYAEGVAP